MAVAGKPVEEDEGAPDKVFLWRLEQFEALGFHREDAAWLADRRHVDLDRARQLKKRGCSNRLIAEILG